MRMLDNSSIGLSLCLLAAACTIGDGDEVNPSPYDSAAITVAAPDGVADGATPVEVTVTGPIGSRLVLVVSGGAGFVVPDAGAPAEKTVFLTDVEGAGQATARVVSASAGTVAVSFKPDPLRTPRSIEFHPVRLAVETASVVALRGGVVEHEVCVASTSSTGVVRTSDLDDEGGTVTLEADISATAPEGLACPTDAVDAVGWNGYAVLEWRSREGSASVLLSHATGEDEATASETVSLAGEAFPGYVVVTGAPVIGDFAVVTLSVSYPALGELPAGPARAVSLTQRFIPAPGPEFLGSSSGAAEDPPTTDAAGEVTLFFDTSEPGTYAWFATLSGGDSVQLDDLVIDVP